MASIGKDDIFGNTGEEDVTKQYIHIRNQQRNGKKSYTTVSGIPSIFNYKKILKYLKTHLNCNGTLVEDENFGTVLQLQGDKRKDLAAFLYTEGIAEKDQIKNHMN